MTTPLVGLSAHAQAPLGGRLQHAATLLDAADRLQREAT